MNFVYLNRNKTGREGAKDTNPALTTQPNKVAVMADQKVLNFTEEEKEVWKDIEGFDGYYQISNKGRVCSWKAGNGSGAFRNEKRILKQQINHRGYNRIWMSINGSEFMKSVHQLVAIAFIPNPENKPEVNHKDGIKTNNYVDNLEWTTHQENEDHAVSTGLKARGERQHASKLTRENVLEARAAFNLGCFTYKEIAEAYGVTRPTMAKAIKGINWKHI